MFFHLPVFSSYCAQPHFFETLTDHTHCRELGGRSMYPIVAAQLLADENGVVIRLPICLDLEKG